MSFYKMGMTAALCEVGLSKTAARQLEDPTQQAPRSYGISHINVNDPLGQQILLNRLNQLQENELADAGMLPLPQEVG